MEIVSRKLISLVAMRKLYLMFALVSVLNIGTLYGIITVTLSDAGSSQTKVSLGGSSVAQSTGSLSNGTGFDVNSWELLGDLFAHTLQDIKFDFSGSPTAKMNVNGGGDLFITGFWVDDDGGTLDDMGLRSSNAVSWSQGDTISLGGSGLINLPFSNFIAGASADKAASTPHFAAADITSVRTAIVPEHDAVSCTLGVVAITLAVVAGSRRRAKLRVG